jgi:sortase B
MQDDDNDLYISHLPDGTENASGSLFADARSSSDFSDPYTFIHGHNMSDGSMFGKLSDFSTQEFYDQHPWMFLFTEDKVYRVDLVSGFTASYEGRFFYLDGSEDARQDLINTAYSSSYFESKSVAPSEDEKLLVLSTCAYQYETARFILLGVLREVKE